MSKTFFATTIALSFALGGGTPALAAPAMAFTPVVIGAAHGLSASGQITLATPAAFRRASGVLRRGSTVYIDSPGGSVAAAMKLGAMFRQSGVTAIVAGVQGSDGMLQAAECFSACVYALMGARQRVVPEQSTVGIHEMAAAGGQLGPQALDMQHEAMRAALVRYAASMGVDASVVEAAESIPHGNLRLLSQSEMRNWRLTSSR